MKYPLTFYTNKGVAKGAAASTRLCLIFILPNKRGDEGLYQHELVHVKQFWFAALGMALVIAAVALLVTPYALTLLGLCLGVHPALYTWSKRYRLWSEVQAYREQLKYYNDDRSFTFAGYIARGYNLGLTEAQALERLRQ